MAKENGLSVSQRTVILRIARHSKLFFPFPIVFRDLSPQHSACHAVSSTVAISEGGSSSERRGVLSPEF